MHSLNECHLRANEFEYSVSSVSSIEPEHGM